MARTAGRLVDVEDDKRWDTLVDRSVHREIYQRSAWLRLLVRSFSLTLSRPALEVDGELVAGLPLLMRRKGPFLLAGSPLHDVATPQMGPVLLEDHYLSPLLDAVDAWQRERQVAFTEIFFPTSVTDELLRSRRYAVAPSTTLHLVLGGTDADAVWQGFEGRCRTAIRKAQRSGVLIRRESDASFVTTYWRMAEDVYARQRMVPPIPRSFYEDLWTTYAGTGALQILSAFHDGQAVASAIFLSGEGYLYYQDGVSYGVSNPLGANNLIQWTIIRWALQHGVQIYDMVGAGLPGIARFKRSFGGTTVERPWAMRANGPLPALALFGYRRWRGLQREARSRLIRRADLGRRR
jgi:predicted N-acyltransferase